MNMRGFGATQRYERINTTHKIETASPHRLIQLMMERVLTKIAMARSHMQRAEVSEKGELIGDAISIINGLQASLNKKADADLPANFDALYDYMMRRLLHANMHNETETLDEVSSLMQELKEAWDAIGDIADAAEPR